MASGGGDASVKLWDLTKYFNQETIDIQSTDEQSHLLDPKNEFQAYLPIWKSDHEWEYTNEESSLNCEVLRFLCIDQECGGIVIVANKCRLWRLSMDTHSVPSNSMLKWDLLFSWPGNPGPIQFGSFLSVGKDVIVMGDSRGGCVVASRSKLFSPFRWLAHPSGTRVAHLHVHILESNPYTEKESRELHECFGLFTAEQSGQIHAWVVHLPKTDETNLSSTQDVRVQLIRRYSLPRKAFTECLVHIPPETLSHVKTSSFACGDSRGNIYLLFDPFSSDSCTSEASFVPIQLLGRNIQAQDKVSPLDTKEIEEAQNQVDELGFAEAMTKEEKRARRIAKKEKEISEETAAFQQNEDSPLSCLFRAHGREQVRWIGIHNRTLYSGGHNGVVNQYTISTAIERSSMQSSHDDSHISETQDPSSIYGKVFYVPLASIKT